MFQWCSSSFAVDQSGELNNKSVVAEGREAEGSGWVGEIVLASARIAISLVDFILDLLADLRIHSYGGLKINQLLESNLKL